MKEFIMDIQRFAGTTFNPGMESLRSGLGMMSMNGDVTEVQSFIKACSGDIVLKVTPATSTLAARTTAWSLPIVVSLETADGDVHKWYSGPVTLAVSKSSSAGTATISPAAGAHYMTDGVLNATLSGDAAAWLENDTATLTATAVAQQGLLNKAISATTCVVTFGA